MGRFFLDASGIYYEAITDIATPTGHTAVQQRAPVVEPLQTTQITFAQLLIGLVAEGWITEAEGDAWLTGTPPAPVLALIGQLPQGQRFAAKARAIRPSIVLLSDPLVQALAAMQGKTTELPAFFNTYGAA